MAMNGSSLDRRVVRIEKLRPKATDEISTGRSRYIRLIEALVAFHFGGHVSGQPIASGTARAYGYGSEQEMQEALIHDEENFNRRRAPIIARLLALKNCAIGASDSGITFTLVSLVSDLSEDQILALDKMGVLKPLELAAIDYMLPGSC